MQSCKIISSSPILLQFLSSSSGSDENGFSPSPSRIFREEEDFLNDRMQEGFLQRILCNEA
ncbi:hypothetical protein MKX01_016329 [Papaver californicum]|nr:hypothetical protein MKX01_016329 [Papaver californicum]